MRRFILALALVLSPLGVGGCASLGGAFEQVQPQTPREALALAEVTFNGAIATAQELHRTGVISTEFARDDVMPKLVQVAELLDVAHRLIRAGDEIQAGQYANAALTVLTELSAELSRRKQAHDAETI